MYSVYVVRCIISCSKNIDFLEQTYAEIYDWNETDAFV